MPKVMPIQPEWLSTQFSGRPIGVDRETGSGVIRGYVVAQLGAFKTPGRGQFDSESLDTIVRLANESSKGLKSRFTHPSLSSDGLGKHLGRAKNYTRDGDKVRADLHLDPSSRRTPNGDLGGYVMDLAESDPDALSSSLVLKSDKVYQLDDHGNPKRDANGNDIPPIWRPTKLHASDIVDTGDAVDGLLTASLDITGLPDEHVRRACEALNVVFADQPREVVEARCSEFLTRYLDMRYGSQRPTVAQLRYQLAERLTRRVG